MLWPTTSKRGGRPGGAVCARVTARPIQLDVPIGTFNTPDSGLRYSFDCVLTLVCASISGAPVYSGTELLSITHSERS